MAKPTLYWDLDGCIARFTCSALALHGRTEHSGQWNTWDFQRSWGLGDAEFYAGQTREFWAGLGVWEDGMALFRYAESLVGQENMVLLTSPVQTEGCSEGKRDWVKRHLPAFLLDLVIGGAKHKLAGPGKILIDDSDSNCEKFEGRGGTAFLVPRPWNTARGDCAADGTFNVSRVSRWLEGVIYDAQM